MNFSTQPGDSTGKFWTPLRSALTLIALALLAGFGVTGCGKPADSTGNANTPKATVTVNASNPGAQANAPKTAATGPTALTASVLDAELKTMEGKPFKLADLKGKVLVIDLWATWCGPCRSSTPELVSLQKEYGPRGFEVIGLDIDPDSDTVEDVQAFAKQFSINYKLAFADREMAISLMRGGNIPQTLVVGRDGRIVEHNVGYHPVRTPEKLRAAIEQALQ
jgi:thiol-disulfide isomerase/thioredoxin